MESERLYQLQLRGWRREWGLPVGPKCVCWGWEEGVGRGWAPCVLVFAEQCLGCPSFLTSSHRISKPERCFIYCPPHREPCPQHRSDGAGGGGADREDGVPPRTQVSALRIPESVSSSRAEWRRRGRSLRRAKTEAAAGSQGSQGSIFTIE